MSSAPSPKSARSLERLRERIAGAENGWFFAQIAEEVALRRKERGLTQVDVAGLVGTTQSAIARLESGGRPPRIDTLLNIAAALECDLVVHLVPRASQPPEGPGTLDQPTP